MRAIFEQERGCPGRFAATDCVCWRPCWPTGHWRCCMQLRVTLIRLCLMMKKTICLTCRWRVGAPFHSSHGRQHEVPAGMVDRRTALSSGCPGRQISWLLSGRAGAGSAGSAAAGDAAAAPASPSPWLERPGEPRCRHSCCPVPGVIATRPAHDPACAAVA